MAAYGESKSIILEEQTEKKGTTEKSSISAGKSFETIKPYLFLSYHDIL